MSITETARVSEARAPNPSRENAGRTDEGLTTTERLRDQPTTFERLGAPGERTGQGTPDYPWDPRGLIYADASARPQGGYTGPDYPWNSGGIVHADEPTVESMAPTVPVNTTWEVDADGFVGNDPRIVAARVPELERTPFADPRGQIENVVLHRTVTRSAEDTLDVFATPSSRGYYFGTHFLVGRDGAIYQSASLDYRTNHVRGHNETSVGIEVVGMPVDAAGEVTLDPNEIVGWEPLTAEQAEAAAYLTNSLNHYYGLGRDDVAVHEALDAKTAGEGQTVYDAIEPMLAE